MTRFYQNLLGKRDGLKQPLPKARALAEAKQWLRSLTPQEAERLLKALPSSERGMKEGTISPPKQAKLYEHPYYWSAFILLGDPN